MESTKIQHEKLVFLGNTSVGKSCIVSRFVHNEFCQFQEPTIGAAFSTNIVDLGNREISFEIWDTAGQERYRSLAPMYYRGSSAAIIVYDITNKDSFIGAKTWVKEIQRRGPSKCIIYIVGNKLDLGDVRTVEIEEVQNYAQSIGISYMEVSAKTGEHVKDMFINIGKQIPEAPEDAKPSEYLLYTRMEESKSIFNFCSLL